jgi:hypothetical protein
MLHLVLVFLDSRPETVVINLCQQVFLSFAKRLEYMHKGRLISHMYGVYVCMRRVCMYVYTYVWICTHGAIFVQANRQTDGQTRTQR